MGGDERNPAYKKDNIRLLRRHLGLTQKEFIEKFLAHGDGTATMSIATYSNLESKGGLRLNEVVLSLSEKLAVDSMVFSMNPEAFAEQIDMLLPNRANQEIIRQSSMKKGNIDQLLNRLTMYFAEQIFDKKLKKCDKIESDRVLAEKLDVGRSAVREALKVLDVMGMIDICPGQGSYISSKEENFFVIPLAWSLFLNGSQVDNILVVRNLLEIKAAELAASCTKEESLLKLHDTSHRLHKAYVQRDYKKFLEEDLDFHLCIAECSENVVIISMIQTIQNLMKHVSGSGMVDEAQLKAIYEEHQRIYGLLMARDGQGASQAMKDHLENAAKRYSYQ